MNVVLEYENWTFLLFISGFSLLHGKIYQYIVPKFYNISFEWDHYGGCYLIIEYTNLYLLFIT